MSRYRTFAVSGVLSSLLLGGVSHAADPQQGSVASHSDRRYPAEIDDARVEVYKTVGDVQLHMYIFEPTTHQRNESRPAIVFFFGGGWRKGTPNQFAPHCRYLASRGMIAMTADYRVLTRHGTKGHVCVTDGKSAIRWVRQEAGRLGVDPDRIAAGGGSAGGHVAACTAVVEGFEQTDEDTTMSSRPNALVLFNPVVVLAAVEGEDFFTAAKGDALRERFGADPSLLSPYHRLKPGLPPAIVFHGKADTAVPYRSVVIFAERAKGNGDHVQLEGYEGQSHGFFNAGRNNNKFFVETLKTLDRFLVDMGFLEGPTPKASAADLLRAAQ